MEGIATRSVGAALLVLGLVTRIVALGLAVDMLVAILLVKRRMAKKAFMERDGTGWEFEFALLAAALALVFMGTGRIALDPLVGL
jgi:putative oxidoreductase